MKNHTGKKTVLFALTLVALAVLGMVSVTGESGNAVTKEAGASGNHAVQYASIWHGGRD